MIVLVTGGRDYKNRKRVFEVLDKIHEELPITLLVHGAAKGADTLADAWAKSRGIKVRSFEVTKEDWDLHGRAAGPIRNTVMLKESKPDLVVAFPGGRGTAHMVKIAKHGNYILLEIPG